MTKEQVQAELEELAQYMDPGLINMIKLSSQKKYANMSNQNIKMDFESKEKITNEKFNSNKNESNNVKN